MRVAILWHEKWHEGLEEASRLYFGDGDVEAMLAILKPLHAELDAGPTTLREASFKQAFRERLEGGGALSSGVRELCGKGTGSLASTIRRDERRRILPRTLRLLPLLRMRRAAAKSAAMKMSRSRRSRKRAKLGMMRMPP